MLPYEICARRSYDNIIITQSCRVKEAYCVDVDGDGSYEIVDVGTFSVSVEPWKGSMEVSKKSILKWLIMVK